MHPCGMTIVLPLDTSMSFWTMCGEGDIVDLSRQQGFSRGNRGKRDDEDEYIFKHQVPFDKIFIAINIEYIP
jgi:hypothetical protein